jgi:DNA-binding PadR family transcriptional regulator
MAMRERSNLLALAVLSTLAQRPMHRYEIASIMRARGKDTDMAVKMGSLYTVVQTLERQGMVEAIGTSRHAGRPERTTYQITPAGRAEMVGWTRELVAEPRPEPTRFVAGLSVLAALSPAEAVEAIRTRVQRLGEMVSTREETLIAVAAEVPRLFLLEEHYAIDQLHAELAWVTALLDELTSGRLPGIPQWQAWHDSGDVPPELAEIAERGAAPTQS